MVLDARYTDCARSCLLVHCLDVVRTGSILSSDLHTHRSL